MTEGGGARPDALWSQRSTANYVPNLTKVQFLTTLYWPDLLCLALLCKHLSVWSLWDYCRSILPPFLPRFSHTTSISLID